MTYPQVPTLSSASLDELRRGLAAEDFTSVDLVKAYITRIEEVQAQLKPVIEINRDAFRVALRLDEERKHGKARGPLHGIPVLIKDNIATHDYLNTTSGSSCLVGAKPLRDATVIKLLRKAGAVILGKTNLSEWANFRSSSSGSSAGWSARGGQTKGAYYKDQYPCGSSSGSAVAASIGLSAGAIGTESDGSITCPSGFNNVVGIKPTKGLTARDLVIPGSIHEDSVGPIAQTVKDAAMLLSTISGYSEYDKATERIPWEAIPDFTKACKTLTLEGKTIGIPSNLIEGPLAVLDTFQAALEVFAHLNATILHKTNVKSWDELSTYDTDLVIMSDFKSGLENYLAKLETNPHRITSLQDIIDYTRRSEDEEYPARDIEGFFDAERSPESSSDQYQTILKESTRLAGGEGIIATLNQYNLDALIAPSLATKATTMAAIAGLPIVSVPMGFYLTGTQIDRDKRGDLIRVAPGIPMGLQIIGRAFDEPRLIEIAHAFEQANQVWRKGKPEVVPTTDLKDVIAWQAEKTVEHSEL